MVLPLGTWRATKERHMAAAALEIPWAEPGLEHGQ